MRTSGRDSRYLPRDLRIVFADVKYGNKISLIVRIIRHFRLDDGPLILEISIMRGKSVILKSCKCRVNEENEQYPG